MKTGQTTIDKATVMKDYVSMLRGGKMKNHILQFRSRGLRSWVACTLEPGTEPEWDWRRFEFRLIRDPSLKA